MTTEVKMPKMGLTMTTATVGKWLKNEGDRVAKGDELVEITTDKITNVVEAPTDGYLLKIAAPAGSELKVADLLAIIGAEGETVAVAQPTAPSGTTETATPPSPAPTPTPHDAASGGKGPAVSPLARKIAAEHGLDLNSVSGTGPGGRITREDVEAALAAKPAAAPAVASAPAAAGENVVLRRIAYVGMRKAIGTTMSASWSAAPRVTQHAAVATHALTTLRAQINEGRDKEQRLSLTDLIVKITARALIEMPDLNGVFDGQEMRVMTDVDMGVAMSTDDGLIVPVIRSANRKSLDEIARESRELAAKAQSRRLTEADITGGTFTISNEGMFRSVDFFSPIINPPQVAILGIGRTVETPVADNGQVVIRPVTGFSLTHDHRIVDGAPAARFMAILERLLANPLAAVI